MPRRVYKKRAARKPRRARRAHRRSGGSRLQYANILNKAAPTKFNPQTPYILLANGLGPTLTTRVAQLGQQFQEYRITKVSVKFMPETNTYGTAGGTGGYIPQIMTKVVDAPVPGIWGAAWLSQMDPKIHELTQKDFGVHYKPVVNFQISNGAISGVAGVGIKRSPWISTNKNAYNGGAWAPDVTPHYGLAIYSDAAGNAQQGFLVQVETHFQFRKPLDSVASVSDPTAAPLVVYNCEY